MPTTPKEVVVAFVRAWFDGDEAAMQQLASAEAIASFHPTPSPATAWTVEDCAEVAQGWACNVHLYEDRDDHVATIGWYEAHVVPDDSGVRIEQLSESL